MILSLLILSFSTNEDFIFILFSSEYKFPLVKQNINEFTLSNLYIVTKLYNNFSMDCKLLSYNKELNEIVMIIPFSFLIPLSKQYFKVLSIIYLNVEFWSLVS